MNRRISRILELLGQKIALWIRIRDFLGAADSPFHAFRARRQNQIGSECGQHPATLQAHRFRHRQGQFITPGRRDISQSNTGITTGRLDDLHSRFQTSALLGIPDHRGTDSALDRIGRIAALYFGQNGRLVAHHPIQLNQWRVADR